jgi:hypothetical protein
LRNWTAKYNDAGFVVIGVHTPEFSFEHELMNVENAVRNLNVTFPVAIDSNQKIWQSFNNQYWPAQYLVDAKGRIRCHHYGEGDYGDIEHVIRELLKENGATGLASDAISVSAVGIEAAPDWADGRSPEARKLAAEAIGIDSHIDTVQRVLVMGEDLGKRWDVGHVDIPRLREGGTHAPFFALPSPNILEDSTGAWRAHSSSCSRPTSSPVPLLASVTPSV